MAIMPDMTGYDRRHKSVGGGSRGVKGCLGGHDDGVSRVDKGVETNRFRHENGDDRQSQNSMSSGVSQSFKIKIPVLQEIQKNRPSPFQDEYFTFLNK